jgi:hypothetical protein
MLIIFVLSVWPIGKKEIYFFKKKIKDKHKNKNRNRKKA